MKLLSINLKLGKLQTNHWILWHSEWHKMCVTPVVFMDLGEHLRMRT